MRVYFFDKEIIIEENETIDYHHNIEIGEVSLNKLNNLKNSGILTEEEYQKAKKKLLD